MADREQAGGTSTMTIEKPFVVIPTYNERENIERLLTIIRSTVARAHCLVVDDDSPDRTWDIVVTMNRSDPMIHLLHRTNERGRGTAGIAGFIHALELGADAIVEMDADFSHNPTDIPRLLEALESHDVVLGSRAVQGGGEEGRPASRQIITRAASLLIKTWLRLPVNDPTSGFRAFRATVFDRVNLTRLRSKGPSIVEEILYYAHRNGFRITEIPIRFEERFAGQSTLTPRILLQTLAFVLSLPFRSRI